MFKYIVKIHKNIQKYKVGGKNTTHLIMAASFWTVLGTFLLCRGLLLLHISGYILFALLAVLVGGLKSRFILDKTAEKNVGRILELQDGACLGAVFSFKTWGLVIVMAGMGMAIRSSGAPEHVTGFFCVIIGFALLFSSRFAWKAWLEKRV